VSVRATLRATLAALALASAAPGFAAEPGTIVVQGSGSVPVAPDLVDVVIGVETIDAKPAQAIDANSAAIGQVIADAVRAGIDRKDIQTNILQLNRVSDPTDKIARFRASNAVRLRLRDVGRLGAVLRDLVGSGANQIQGVRFSVENPAPHLDAARRQAVADARRKAEVLAEAAGQHLDGVLEITDSTVDHRPIPMAREAALSAAEVPVEAGQITLRAAVSMKWRLAP
jgi:uncharacterized protein YggE